VNVLLAFTTRERVLGVSELARRLDLSKAVVHRTMSVLAGSGLLARDVGGRYRLGPSALQLGIVALGGSDLLSRATPLLDELSRESRETATFSLLLGRERMYVAQSEGPEVVRMKVGVGERFPLFAGASGRAMLAFFSPDELDQYLEHAELTALTDKTITDADALRRDLARVRKAGFATSFGERDAYAASVAAPLFGVHGGIVGSLSICGPLARFTREAIGAHTRLVLAAAAELSSARAETPLGDEGG
jgi:DNA-binding IclR family transcriptional regulator